LLPSRRPQTLSECLRAALAFLEAAGDEEARLSAEYLLAKVLACELQDLMLQRVDPPNDAQWQEFSALLQRRAAGEPVAYLEGSRGFYGREFLVGPGVLIPRPDSETLVEAALACAGDQKLGKLIDLGVGSGALLLSVLAELPSWSGLGVDLSEVALGYAQRNAESLGLSARVDWLQSDWLQSVPADQFDLVLANPPYIEPSEWVGPGVAEFEPHAALYTPPKDAMQPYREILKGLPACTAASTELLFEVGAERATQVIELAQQFGWEHARTHIDLGGVERVVQLRRAAREL